MTRKSSGEFYAQLKAEASNPRGDIWWGGTGDPHLQAAEEELTEVYRSERLAELYPWAIAHAEQSKYRSVAIGSAVLGFSYNAEQLAKRNLPAPRCWVDLVKSEYRGEVQMPNPHASGTAYSVLTTMVQLYGDDGGFDYLKRLDVNINGYARNGGAPAVAAARGETLIAITYMHDAVTQIVNRFPLKIVAPCEGTGYAIGAMSLIKGGPNPGPARQWYEFAMTAEAQEIGLKLQRYEYPSNMNAKVPAETPDMRNFKVIEYDFKRFGGSEERKRLLARWDAEVAARR
jgi:iron(III) transport system substrate-binding protein